MEKEFVTYELALELKQLGFNEPCLASYETAFGKNGPDFQIGYIIDGPKNYVLVPTFSQAFRWFREKYGLKEQYGVFPHHTLMFNYVMEGGKEEDAELACLKKLIEIVKSE